jgi:tRNA(Ile)-lysidine synthase TilS/MesJ
MTTDQALEQMRNIAHKHKDDPERARREGIELLCMIARRSGFYEAADEFEKMKKS